MPFTRELPPHLEELYSRAQIETRLAVLAADLDLWAAETRTTHGKALLVVCILRGGVFFFSDLLLRMRASVEPAFCRASSYGVTVNGQPQSEIKFDLGDLAFTGRDVVLVDNICDSGRTFERLARQMNADGALRVRTVSMVHRLRTDSQHTPTLAGFTYAGSEWLAGYGLRDQSERMNFPAIYRVVK